MKKIIFILFAATLFGCAVPTEQVEKDKTLLKSPGLSYAHLLLNWNEPIEVKYLNTNKFIAVWDRGAGLGSGYQVRVLFERRKVMGYKIEEIDLDKVISAEISMSSK